jgi:hypothetical protein
MMPNTQQRDITAVLRALRALELERPGLTAKLILYTDGEGAMALEDVRFGQFRAAVDFSEDADLLKVVEKLRESENLLDE